MTTSNDSIPPGSFNIVLGVCGGVAAYKAVELLRGFTKAGYKVQCVLTQSATKMVGAKTFDALSSEPAVVDFWESTRVSPHTELGQWSNLVVIAPATARVISDLAAGRSADVLTATCLATEAPIVVCPAMHTEMWNNSSTQQNVTKLIEMGMVVVEPQEGELAGGDVGMGRLADLDSIQGAVNGVLANSTRLRKVRVLITAGATREPIDPVRYITNRSTGRQGHALASAAQLAGANVTLISASSLPSPKGVRRVNVETAEEMFQAVQSEIDQSDVFISCAAVADFTPASYSNEKIKKADGLGEIKLVPTVDILATVTQARKESQVFVGFAAESSDIERNADLKLKSKALDMIVANDISRNGSAFGSSTNSVVIQHRGGATIEVSRRSKQEVAAVIISAVCKLIESKE